MSILLRNYEEDVDLLKEKAELSEKANFCHAEYVWVMLYIGEQKGWKQAERMLSI